MARSPSRFPALEGIWAIEDLAARFERFAIRYQDLDELTGNRTVNERDEMAEIADAILPRLIIFWMRAGMPALDDNGRRKART